MLSLEELLLKKQILTNVLLFYLIIFKKLIRFDFTSFKTENLVPLIYTPCMVPLYFRTDSGTTVELHQTGIPSSDFTRTKDGWKRYYWDSLKVTFGFGAMLS